VDAADPARRALRAAQVRGVHRLAQHVRNILSDRLVRLVSRGLLDSVVHQTNPVRTEYTLTKMGDEFFSVLVAMVEWGDDRWLDGGTGAPVTLHHVPCEHDLEPSVVCTHCWQAIRSSDIQFWVGPGPTTSPDVVGAPLSGPPRHP